LKIPPHLKHVVEALLAESLSLQAIPTTHLFVVWSVCLSREILNSKSLAKTCNSLFMIHQVAASISIDSAYDKITLVTCCRLLAV